MCPPRYRHLIGSMLSLKKFDRFWYQKRTQGGLCHHMGWNCESKQYKNIILYMQNRLHDWPIYLGLPTIWLLISKWPISHAWFRVISRENDQKSYVNVVLWIPTLGLMYTLYYIHSRKNSYVKNPLRDFAWFCVNLDLFLLNSWWLLGLTCICAMSAESLDPEMDAATWFTIMWILFVSEMVWLAIYYNNIIYIYT